MDKKIIISLLTSIALSSANMAQTGYREETYSAFTKAGALSLQIIKAFNRQIEDPTVDSVPIQATRTTVSKWLKLIKQESFLVALEDFRKFQSMDLRNYKYQDTHGKTHLDVHAYKDNLIQQFMSSYMKLLELSNTSFWPESTLKKILIQNMDVLVDIKNLATAYQDYDNPKKLGVFGFYKK